MVYCVHGSGMDTCKEKNIEKRKVDILCFIYYIIGTNRASPTLVAVVNYRIDSQQHCYMPNMLKEKDDRTRSMFLFMFSKLV